MSLPYQVQNLTAEQDSGNILLTWQGVLGATSYQINRSTDGVNFTSLVTSATNQHIDSLPGTGIKFYYQVAAVNSSGTGSFSSTAHMVSAPPSEMSLYELRLRSQQTADRVNSQFVDTAEWNSFIRLAAYELYDLLVTSYEDYFAQSVIFSTDGTTTNYPLPNGVSNFLTSSIPAPAFYKLLGVDLGVNTSNNAWVTVNKFDFIDRNKYVYPNSNSTIYGAFNMRYRVVGNNINFIPTPSSSQQIRLWYVPKLPSLMSDTDLTNIGISGWLRYVIVRAAKYALEKEEGSDTSNLSQELVFLKQRIQESSQNRDVGQPDTISDTRNDGMFGNSWGGQGGW